MATITDMREEVRLRYTAAVAAHTSQGGPPKHEAVALSGLAARKVTCSTDAGPATATTGTTDVPPTGGYR